MQDWRENKAVLIGLIAVVLCVWGYNAYQVYNRLEAPDESDTATSSFEMPSLHNVSADTSLAFVRLVRDPFAVPVRAIRASRAQNTQTAPIQIASPPPVYENYTPPPVYTPPPPPVEPPRVQLVGVMNQTAMLRDAEGKTMILSLNEETQGIRLVLIKPEYIEFMYQQQRFSLKLRN